MGKALTREQEQWAYQKWCDGYSREEIARALYVSAKPIHECLRGKKKVKKPLVCEWKNEREFGAYLTRTQRLWIIQKWDEGYQQKEIAEAIGVRKATVQRLLCYRNREHPVLKYEMEGKMDEAEITKAVKTAISQEGIKAIVEECEKQPSKGEDTCKRCRFRNLKPGKTIHGCVFNLCPLEWDI